MWQIGRKLLERLNLRTSGAATACDSREYAAALPDGFGARRVRLRLSRPALPERPTLSFSDHAMDADGRPTDIVLAVCQGGFALSHDLGRRWSRVNVKGYERHSFVRAKWLGNSEILAQASIGRGAENDKKSVDLLVLSENGAIRARHPAQGHRWHGCRSVDRSGQTLMYAEYPRNKPVNGKRISSGRVLRSRDMGRSWETVFEKSGSEIRHFHFLQARPGRPGEWWLTSGDYPHECHIWISRDDGDSWTKWTAPLSQGFSLDGTHFGADAFRLTDLVWTDHEVIWATDDTLVKSAPPGARVFRSVTDSLLAPELIGLGRWHFRSIVDLDGHYLLLSQRAGHEGGRGPGIYLLAKHTNAFTHLFDLDSYWTREGTAGFTCSLASRKARDGTFFSYRSDDDVFAGGHRLLEWKVAFE
jgi:hypothetical protein